MGWQTLTVTIDKAHAEQLNEALELAGALSVTLEDAQDEPIFELPPDAILLWTRCKITGLFEDDYDLQTLIKQLEQDLAIPLEIQIAELADQDWVRVCLEQFKPMCFGQRLWVVPSWEIEVERPQGVCVQLDPGLAFGTGSHPTTRLMLEWLDSADLENKTVIDYGCGSGILGIAAAKLGAARVIGVDYDPQALTATRNNSEENKVIVETYFPAGANTSGTSPTLPEIQADLILANIIVNPLIELMPVFLSHLKPGGSLILSGILKEQEQYLLSHIPTHFIHRATTQHEDWIRVDLQLGS